MPPPAPPEVRARAIQLVPTVGVREAARQCGVSAGAVSRWALEANVSNVHREQTRAAAATVHANNEARRAALTNKLLQVAEAGVERELELIAHPKADLHSVVGARTRAIHDAQLLAGQATSRTETRSELDTELETLAAKVAADAG